MAESEEITIAQAEERVLGVTHAEVGGWLAEKWNLPESLVEAISYHHDLSELDEPEPIVLLTHISNALIRHRKIGNSGDQQSEFLDPEVAQVFKREEDISNEELLERLGKGLEEELEKASIFSEL